MTRINPNTESQRHRPNRKKRIQAAHQAIDRHFTALAEEMSRGKSDRLLQYLQFASRFHRYSISNQILIWSQRPTATFVAGIRRWNELGRHVRRGEQGLLIFAPIRYRRESSSRREQDGPAVTEANEEQEIMTFRAVYVFDVSQTEGDPIPDLIHAEGDVADLLPAMHRVIAGQEIELIVAGDDNPHAVPPGAEGASFGGRIAIRAELSEPDAFRVLAHELAHELLHHRGQPRPDRKIRETEADATAYIVCRHFGVTCDASDYLLMYDSDPQVLMARLDTIRLTAATIIDGIESQVKAKSDPPIGQASDCGADTEPVPMSATA